MDRRELERAAVRHHYLRGLRTVPFGAVALLAALGNWGVAPFDNNAVFLACLAAIGVVTWGIERHYREHYGRATLAGPQARREGLAFAATIAVNLLLGFVLRSNASFSL